MKFFDDIDIGETWEIGSHIFDAAEIKRFARAFDPQPFHLDETAAARSHFGALCASGWHTLAIWMQLNVADWNRRMEEQTAAGTDSPRIGPSPGFDDLRWLKPVYAGDTISYRCEVVAKRESRSRPAWGVLSFRGTGSNQSGEDVVSFTGHVFVERRSGAAV